MVFKISITVLITVLLLIVFVVGLASTWERQRLKTLIYIIKVALILILLSIPTIILSCVWEV